MAWVEGQSRAADKLSAEELRLWDCIHTSKILTQLAADHDVSIVRPVVEDDLVAAIATLKESTLAIERQTKLFQSYHRQLNAFGNQRDEKIQAIHGAAGSIARKEALELQQLALQVDEEDKALMSGLESVSEDLTQSSRNIKRNLHEHLREDDRRLQTLQTLAIPRYESGGPENSSGNDFSALLEKLVDFTCQETQLRLDRTYLEQLGKQPRGQYQAHDNQAAQECSLQSDLNSLYTEIRDVVRMSAPQEFESSLRETRDHEAKRRRAYDGVALKFILHSLSDLTQSLEDRSNLLELYCSYCLSIAAVKTEYLSQLAVDQSLAIQAPPTPLAEGRLELTTKSSALLRHVGVSSEGMADHQSIGRALVKKVARLAQPRTNNAVVPDAILRKTLTTSDYGSQLLTTAVQDSGDGNPKAFSRQVSVPNLEALDDNIAQIRQKVEVIDLGKDSEPSKAHKQFLARWS